MLDAVIELVHQGIITSASLLAVPLLAALGVSILMAALQTMTSMHDATIALVPRLAVIAGTLLLLSPWILGKLVLFAVEMLQWNGSGSFGG